MGSININGRTYSGDNITVNNGQIIIDGENITFDKNQPQIKVIVTGNLNKLKCTTAEINGNVIGNVNATTLKCKDIGGKVDANTVTCEMIGGDVDANTVKTEFIKGNVDANTVKYKNK